MFSLRKKFFIYSVLALALFLVLSSSSIVQAKTIYLGDSDDDVLSAPLKITAPAGAEALRLITASDWSPFNIRNTANDTDIFRVDQTGTLVVGIIPGARIDGEVSLATSLAANGGNCPAGYYPLGVDEDGNVESCTLIADGADNLGDHSATQNIKLNSYWLSGDGGDEGIYVTADGNIGIGMTNPADTSDKLKVTGNGNERAFRSMGDILFESYDEVTKLEMNDGVFQLFSPLGIVSMGDLEGDGHNNYLQIDDANSKFIFNGGNVGIGTTEPHAKLEVSGSIRMSGSLNDASGFGILGYDTYSPGAYAMGNDEGLNRNFVFWGDVGEIATFKSSSGYVGIGTTIPYAKLEVSGGDIYLHADGHSPRILLGDGLNEGTFGVLQWNSTNDYMQLSGDSSGSTGITVKEGGNVGIGVTGPGAKLDVNGSFRANSSVTFSNLAGTGIRSVTVDASGVLGSSVVSTLPSGTLGQTLRYNGLAWVANSNLWNGGTNIGIGTTNPQATLEINGGSNPATLIISPGGGEDSKLHFYGNGTPKLSLLYYDEVHEAQISTYNNCGGTSCGIVPLVFNVGGSEAMRISDTNGNVGIGTDDPSAKLHIDGSLIAESSVTFSDLAGTGLRSVTVDASGNLSTIAIPASSGAGISSTIIVKDAIMDRDCLVTFDDGIITSTTCSVPLGG